MGARSCDCRLDFVAQAILRRSNLELRKSAVALDRVAPGTAISERRIHPAEPLGWPRAAGCTRRSARAGTVPMHDKLPGIKPELTPSAVGSATVSVALASVSLARLDQLPAHALLGVTPSRAGQTPALPATLRAGATLPFTVPMHDKLPGIKAHYDRGLPRVGAAPHFAKCAALDLPARCSSSLRCRRSAVGWRCLWRRGSQVVRQGSAKPLCVGSIQTLASTPNCVCSKDL